MDTIDGLTFVNRGEELKYLRQCLQRVENRPALIVIRAPSGVGKSTLTDRLINTGSFEGRSFCVVDPSIRGRAGAVVLYDGFFLQRIAENLDRASSLPQVAWPSLSDFIKTRRRDAALTKNPVDIVSELPTPKHAYKIAFDYFARAFAFGRYTPEKLLVSDQADAIATCCAYTEHVLCENMIVLIVREAQHIDLQSLRSLLQLSERHPGPDIVFEYTTESGKFDPEHQKLLLRGAGSRGEIAILDLLRLSQDNLEYLIRTNIRNDFDLTSDYYLSWDGNLRSVIELKFDVRVGTFLTDNSVIARTLANLSDSIGEHLMRLSTMERLLLAMVLAHVEAIELTTLETVTARIDPRALHSEINKALDRLENEHVFITRTGNSVALRNDTIAEAIQGIESLKGLIALSEKTLRDYYGELMGGDSGIFNLTGVLRQYFRLCAKTKDIQGLSQAAMSLSNEISGARDQAIYIDAVASAIEADPELFHGEHDDLIIWAAELAYGSSDWQRASKILSLLRSPTPHTELMRACALQEIGGHDEALKIVSTQRIGATDTQLMLALDLIQALVIGCRGQHSEARKILEAAIQNKDYRRSPLLGFGYRFFEIVDGRVDSLKNLEASVRYFELHHLPLSKAYSKLSAAILLARSGEISDARKSLSTATDALSNVVHDQHMILNNASAIELLSDRPDYEYCCQALSKALRLARNDFSELTILSNMSLALLGRNDLSGAIVAADKCRLLLAEHDFADTDIYWPVSFNNSVVYQSNGDDIRQRAAEKFPSENGIHEPNDFSYWRFRFGLDHICPETHEFLASRRWHPVYLSHWLIDLEGLSLLKPKQPE